MKQKGNRNRHETVPKQAETGLKLVNQRVSVTVLSGALSELWKCVETTLNQCWNNAEMKLKWNLDATEIKLKWNRKETGTCMKQSRIERESANQAAACFFYNPLRNTFRALKVPEITLNLTYAEMKLKWNWNTTEMKHKGNRNRYETVPKQTETGLTQYWKRLNW